MCAETTLPRTWTLQQALYVDHLLFEMEAGDALEVGAQVHVIEREPLLDLLAFFVGLHGECYTMSEDAERDAEAILRAHGRLGP